MKYVPDTSYPAASTRAKAAAPREPDPPPSISSSIHRRRAARAAAPSARRGGDSRPGANRSSSDAVMERYKRHGQT